MSEGHALLEYREQLLVYHYFLYYLSRVTLPTRGQYTHKGGELESRVHGIQDSATFLQPGPGLTLSTY